MNGKMKLAVIVTVLICAVLAAGCGSAAPPTAAAPTLSNSRYDAVFLRLEVVDRSPEVLVVGVNAEGQERQIARLAGAWLAYEILSANEGCCLAPQGAVSPSGLLAIPSNRGERRHMMHWEIIDVHRPEEGPIVIAAIRDQFLERVHPGPYLSAEQGGGALWGPGERLAIVEHGQLWYVEGRTGVARLVDFSDELLVLPSWAPDGSGVFVGSTTADRPRLLRFDGSMGGQTQAVAERNCRTRLRSGAEITISGGRIARLNPDGSRVELHRPMPADGYACLAPDDSAVVHNGIAGSRASKPKAGLLGLQRGGSSEVEGQFAGWIEVDR